DKIKNQLTGAHAGTITTIVGGSTTNTIQYQNLTPVDETGYTAADLEFDLPTGGVNSAVLDTFSGTTHRLSGAGTFEQTDFSATTGTVTIVRGNATDAMTVGSLTSFGNLVIGDAVNTFSTISFAGATAFASNKNLLGFASGTIDFPNATSDIATQGAGSIS